MLQIDKHQHGAALVVTATGEVDMRTAPQLDAAVQNALNEVGHGPCVVDLRKVTFLGSPGLNALVRAANHAERRPGPLLIVVDANRPVVRPIELTGLDDILALYHTIDEALASRHNQPKS